MTRAKYVDLFFEVFRSDQLLLSEAHAYFSQYAVDMLEKGDFIEYILPDFVEVKLRKNAERFDTRIDFTWRDSKPIYLTDMQASLPIESVYVGNYYAEASDWEKRHLIRSERSIERLFHEIEELIKEFNR